jgi:hypothetical protein
MSEHPSRPSTTDDEIDLSVVFKAIQNFFKRILIGIVNIVQFYWRHKFILIGLIIAGAVLGYFWDKSFDKTYKNQLLVIPNFESANYLYNKIESIESKLSAGDTVFLKEVFGDEYESVSSVEISPILDLYNFVSLRESNQEVFELLFEEEANLEFLEDPINSRNYEFHRISLYVNGEKNHDVFSNRLINYLNNNSHFKSIKKVVVKNLDLQVKQSNKIIQQIDSILASSNSNKGLKYQENQLSFNDNTGLNELIKMKRDLLFKEGMLRESIIEKSQIINLVDSDYKILDKEKLIKKSKIKLFPLILLMLYSLIFFIRYLSKKAKELTA